MAFFERRNSRGFQENVWSKEHSTLATLRARRFNNYLQKTRFPAFPQPEFHVSHLQHDTDAVGLDRIKTDGGFKGKDNLLWWSLAVKPEDLAAAEGRPMNIIYPERTEAQVQPQPQAQDQVQVLAQAMEQVQIQNQPQAQAQSKFLGKFASSPAFLKTSRLGSYRFSFSVKEVLDAYKEQFCKEAPPVMRVYETVLYSQEVMYVVLVHSPEVDKAVKKKYKKYPRLSDDPEAVCCYKDGHFIWRSQAMCETHRYRLVQRPNQMKAEKVDEKKNEVEFYVWDHVAIALHMEEGQVLKFDAKRLRETLTFCNKGIPSISRHGHQEKSKAVEIVQKLWPDHGEALEEERSLQETQEAPADTDSDLSD